MKCFSQFSSAVRYSWTVCACFGTSSGVTSGLYMCIMGRLSTILAESATSLRVDGLLSPVSRSIVASPTPSVHA